MTKSPDVSKKIAFYTSNTENAGFVQQELDKVVFMLMFKFDV